MYFFQTKQMSVGYDGKALIKDIEIGVNAGEILTLIGPNGAGKSTILKSIAGQLELIGGAVYIGQEELARMDGHARSQRMAVVFTDRGGMELMNCREVVAGGRYPYTGRLGLLSAADWRAVDEAMALVHVSELSATPFHRISDGQRQRVLLARAIAQETPLLLLDEPTSYLDVRYKLEFLAALQELSRRRGVTVIMSLHELDLAQRISDKVLCVKGEYVERFGTSEEVFTDGYITQLFGVTRGFYEEGSGIIELEAPAGAPGVFVIGGGGSARALYRRLQREGTPFATGILYDNDLDCPTARALAARTLVAPAFAPVPDALLAEAKSLIDECGRVLCTRETFGTDEANRRLYEYAEGKVFC